MMAFINNQNPHRRETITADDLLADDDTPPPDNAPAFKMKPSVVFGAIFGEK